MLPLPSFADVCAEIAAAYGDLRRSGDGAGDATPLVSGPDDADADATAPQSGSASPRAPPATAATTSPAHAPPSSSASSSWELSSFPALRSRSPADVQLRYLLARYVTAAVAATMHAGGLPLPLRDALAVDAAAGQDAATLAAASAATADGGAHATAPAPPPWAGAVWDAPPDVTACASVCRCLVLFDLKSAWVRAALVATAGAGRGARPRMSINRFAAVSPASWQATLLGQAAVALARVPPAALRQEATAPHLCFEVRLQGERVAGEGGPYREFLSAAVAEAMGHASEGGGADAPAVPPLFIPTPNSATGTGDDRDARVPRPGATAAADLARFECLGVLIGCALRTGVRVPLTLPSLLWKLLIGDVYVTTADHGSLAPSPTPPLLPPLPLPPRVTTAAASAAAPAGGSGGSPRRSRAAGSGAGGAAAVDLDSPPRARRTGTEGGRFGRRLAASPLPSPRAPPPPPHARLQPCAFGALPLSQSLSPDAPGITLGDLDAIDHALVAGIIVPLRDAAAVAGGGGKEAFERRFGGGCSHGDGDGGTPTEASPHHRHDGDGDTATAMLTFSTVLPSGQRVEAFPGGAATPVAFAEAARAAAWLQRAHVACYLPAAAALRRGVARVVPLAALSLLTWREAAALVAGAPDLDVDVLARHTEYAPGLTPATTPHVRWLWAWLRASPPATKARFARFVFGQERLPSADADWDAAGLRLLIKSTARPGAAMPALGGGRAAGRAAVAGSRAGGSGGGSGGGSIALGFAHGVLASFGGGAAGGYAALGGGGGGTARAPAAMTQAHVDAQLPTSDACFGNVDVPAYSSAAVLRARLELAIAEASMDADDV